jgi:hypothetical protein
MSITGSEAGCMISDLMLLPGDTAVPAVVLNHVDTDGTVWALQDIEGWWTLPPSTVLDIPRPQKQDGSYDVEGNYLPRLVTITGHFRPSSPSLVPQKRSQLLRACDTMRGPALQIQANEDARTPLGLWKMALGRLADQPQVQTTKASGQTDFQIAFKCWDPRKYSVAEYGGGVAVTVFTRVTTGWAYPTPTGVTGRPYPLTPLNPLYDPTKQPWDPTNVATYKAGSAWMYSNGRAYGGLSSAEGQIIATNAGTVASAPTIELHGPLTSPAILNYTTSQVLSFPGLSIADGEIVTIDVMEHSAISGNSAQRVSYLALDSVWWWVQPGQNVVRLQADSGIGYMVFKWRSAWME